MPDGSARGFDPAAILTATVRDLGYLAVGFGLLGFQRAQVRRRELERRFGCDLAKTLRRATGRS